MRTLLQNKCAQLLIIIIIRGKVLTWHTRHAKDASMNGRHESMVDLHNARHVIALSGM